MDVNHQRGNRTLLASILLSAPGPLVLGWGLMHGSSSTQIADFVRRTVELAATGLALYVYRSTAANAIDDPRRLRMERRVDLTVGGALLISSVAMAILSIAGFVLQKEQGNVIPALVIAILGVISNGILALNYARANARNPNDVLHAQGMLYRTKTVVDACVCSALLVVTMLSGDIARVADLLGGLTITVVLCANGIKLIRARLERPVPERSHGQVQSPSSPEQPVEEIA